MKCDLMSILLFFFFAGVLLVSGEIGDRTVMCKVLFQFVIIKHVKFCQTSSAPLSRGYGDFL